MIKIKNIPDYTYFYLFKDYYEKSMNDFTEISSRIKPYFLVNNINYWDMLNYFLWASSFYFRDKPGLDYILRTLYDLDKKIKEDVEIDATGYFPETYVRLAKKVCEKKRCRVISISKDKKLKLTGRILQQPTVLRPMLKTRFRIRHLFGIIRKLMKKTDKNQKEVLFLSNIRFCKADVEKNILYQDIAKELSKKNISYKYLIYEEVLQLYNLKRFFREFLTKKSAYIGDYYTAEHFRKCKNDFIALRKRWQETRGKPEFRQIFSYNGINFYDEVRPRLDLIFNAISYASLDALNITEQIVKEEKYKVLIMDHEENLYGKAFLLNTRREKNRRAVALSYELIMPGCYHTYTKSKEALDRNSLMWRPLPNAKCVWGDYARKVLLDSCNYTSDLIQITGNPKFDSILNKKYDDEELRKKYPFMYTEKTKLLIASDVVPSNYPIYKRLAEENKDVVVVFKPHPSEHMNLIEKAFGVKAGSSIGNLHMVDKNENFYELMHLTDYLLTFSSTTAFEAMLFGKPVLLLNTKKSSIVGLPYLEYGAAVEIYNTNELKQVLKKLSQAKELQRLNNNMLKFIKELHPYNDGKAASRVSKVIEQQMGMLK
jgi:hypothetical protein